MILELHAGLGLLVRGYSLESEGKVDVVNDTMQEFCEDDEIMMILGYPYLALD